MTEFTPWLGRAAAGAAVFHLVLLAALPLYGHLAYGYIYERVQPREASALRDSYLAFLWIGGAALALTLTVGSAAFGLWRGRAWLGAGALLAGTAASMAALSVLPTVYFPHDQYPAPAAWMFGNGLKVLVGWGLLTLAGWAAVRPPTPRRPAEPNHDPEPAARGGRG